VHQTKFIGGGVSAVYSSRPVLGDGGATSGHNCFTSIDGYYVTNMTEWVCVPADSNKWGKGCCTPSKFYGCVDCADCDETCQASPPGQMAPPFAFEEPGDAPATFALRPVAPNPFNPVTVIRYEVPAPGARVRIAVYDVAGRRVADLVDEQKGPGHYAVRWDGTERRGGQVASGVYFIHMRAGSFRHTVKAVVLK